MSIDFALFPLDTIKTRLQSLGTNNEINSTKSINMEKVSKYSGLKSSMIASFPAAAVFFGTYDFTKYYLKNKVNIKRDYYVHVIASIVGESCQNLVRNPFELIKQNMQIGKYNSILEANQNIYRKSGILVIIN